MRILGRPWLFDLGSGIYAWFNSNPLWRESCAHLAAFFPEPNGRRPPRVVDLGCGPGLTAIALAEVRPDARIIGVDLAPRMIDVAQKETGRANLTRNISYVIADATALPFPNDAVDVTTGHSFLYLVPDRAGVLQEAHRVLRSGGKYASMEPRFAPTRDSVLRRHWRDLRFLVSITLWRPYSKYHGRLDESSFPAILQQAGFGKTGTEPALEGLGIVGYGEKS
jgi:ubiquinone/menaquinone biosynthesis C-methylase UbiE